MLLLRIPYKKNHDLQYNMPGEPIQTLRPPNESILRKIQFLGGGASGVLEERDGRYQDDLRYCLRALFWAAKRDFLRGALDSASIPLVRLLLLSTVVRQPSGTGHWLHPCLRRTLPVFRGSLPPYLAFGVGEASHSKVVDRSGMVQTLGSCSAVQVDIGP